ncbi:MAG: response regulator [Bacteroidota bacterium]
MPGNSIYPLPIPASALPKKNRKEYLNVFYQVNEGGAHSDIGTGIGLALVRELTELMDGNIKVNSELAKGSEFKVSLPLEFASASEVEDDIFAGMIQPIGPVSEDPEKENDDLPASKAKVLVVEDNNDLRKFIVDAFRNQYHLMEAADGKIGYDIATREIPEIIISDVMMPEMDGITMVKKLKKDFRTSHIAIILLTAKATEFDKLSGLTSGADDYLTKPFNKQELLLKVRNSLFVREQLREKVRIKLLGENSSEFQTDEGRFLLKVKNVIDQRLSDESFTVESLAGEIGLSRVQLYRKIIALTGLSVNELIRTFRLQKAARLLRQNWGPVSQVSYEVGISNLSYFSKAFKEKYGVLPSEYNKTENPNRVIPRTDQLAFDTKTKITCGIIGPKAARPRFGKKFLKIRV